MAINNLESSINQKIEQWLNGNYNDETKKSIQELIDKNNLEELNDAFYKDLSFGTGGLRGLMGVGTNRMNIYTIGKATQGLANYLKKTYSNQSIKVAVSFDSRNSSPLFAQTVADVFSANDIYVYLFNELRPTPELSFAIRKLGCQSGVMITASHNPKEYNGYKAYWNDGGQLIAPHDNNVIQEVNALSINEVKFDKNDALIKKIDDEIDQLYFKELVDLSLHPDAVSQQQNLKIVYSPIHGTGITAVPKVLSLWGFTNVHVVASQATPDGNFPTVIYPNPEEEEAMSKGLEEAVALDADLLLATDPDADRVGVAVKNHEGAFQLLNGNQIGSLLVDYVLKIKSEKNQLQENDFTCKTIVTTNLIQEISSSYNIKCYEVLTGFKYIGELMTDLLGKENFLVGGEESYGYLVGDLVRDKDAIVSCAFIAEMTAYYKSQGQSLYEALTSLYLNHGFYREKLISLTKKGKSGAEEIKAMMDRLRTSPPKTLGGNPVALVKDYENSVSIDQLSGAKETINLPKSDVLQFITSDGSVVSARPSGTEPKIKFYCSARLPLDSPTNYKLIEENLERKIEEMMSDILQ
ncbi:phospho-sugar mutase [Olivibacter domesticus]|uniref:Phosphoglucomutase n=1 Tax=Olivibacter domesticus TaxID=407022 RepID=A0A1H7Z027_OLID1|nr:phospho-sugar mutase [Olivibacter domesticus]SEM50849.1 phosphoglucomutase [Olivibacter domesticus]